MPANLVRPWHSIIQPTGLGQHNCLRGYFSYVSLSRHLQLFTSVLCPRLTSAWSLRRLCNWNLPLQQLTPCSPTAGSITALSFCLPQVRCGGGPRRGRSLPRRAPHLFKVRKARISSRNLLWGMQKASVGPGVFSCIQPLAPRFQAKVAMAFKKEKKTKPNIEGAATACALSYGRAVPIRAYREAFSLNI